MINKKSRFLKTPKCINTTMGYPELWKDAFGGQNSDSPYCKCMELCENRTPLRVCFSEKQYIASVFDYPTRGGCSLPHLGYETCKQSAYLINKRIWAGSAFETHAADLHMEARALVLELGHKKESCPANFFVWLDGCLKNAWHSFKKESEIGKKTSNHIRKYMVFALTSTGKDMTREKMSKLRKACLKELETLKKICLDNPKGEKDLHCKIKEMEEKLSELTPLYEGSRAVQGDQDFNEDNPDNVQIKSIKSGDSAWVETEEKLCREEDLYYLRSCLETLRNERPELAEVVDKFLEPVIEQDGGRQARDADVSQALNLPIHTIRRRMEKAEALLRIYMSQKGFAAEDIHA